MLLETLITTVNMLASVIPNPAPVQPPGTEGVVTITSWAKGLGFSIAGIAIVVAGIRMVVTHRRGEGGEHVGVLGYILAGIIIIGGGIGLVGALIGG